MNAIAEKSKNTKEYVLSETVGTVQGKKANLVKY
jgi:hypothetical protein